MPSPVASRLAVAGARHILRSLIGPGAISPTKSSWPGPPKSVGLPRRLADELAARYGDIEPWPEAGEVLGKLLEAGMPLGVVTNCSEALGRLAAGRIPVPFSVIVTAERAVHYKPDPRPYRLALNELGVTAENCLFVAGSAYDLFGTARVGMPTWWHDRIGMTAPPDTPSPIAHHRTLTPLLAHALS